MGLPSLCLASCRVDHRGRFRHSEACLYYSPHSAYLFEESDEEELSLEGPAVGPGHPEFDSRIIEEYAILETLDGFSSRSRSRSEGEDDDVHSAQDDVF